MISPDAELLFLLNRTIREQCLFEPDDTIIVAVSGGADSTALLDLLTRLPGCNLKLIAAHLNHCLRGADSDADEEFCRQLAAHYSIPFETRRVDVRAMAESGKLNLEDSGRRARITFLDELRRKTGAAAIALGHHADDQAETVLMRLLRGSGTTGLSGMAGRNARGYVRPLLEISRDRLREYLREQKLNWREDNSNSDTSYLRNRLRHELLPLLAGYNPAIRSCLAATAALLAEDEVLLDELAEQAFAGSCRISDGDIVCSTGQLRTLNTALRRRVLRHAVRELTGTLEGVNRCHIEAIIALIDSDRPNARVVLPQGVQLIREYDRLVCTTNRPPQLETDFELLIPEPGVYQLHDGRSITVDLIEATSLPTDSGTAYFDPAAFPFPWKIRTFRPGDRIIPFGMTGRKKVKDIFIDQKVPPAERKRIPLLFCGSDLIWLAGLLSSELSRVNYKGGIVARVCCTNR